MKNKSLMLSVTALVLSALCLLPGCGSPEIGGDETTPAVIHVTDAESDAETEAFVPKDVNYGDEEFNIFNSEQKYNMLMNIISDECDGDAVSNAKYSATARVEEMYHVTLKEHNAKWDDMYNDILPLVSSGDTTYDVVYLRSTQVSSMFTQNYLINMYDLEPTTVDISREWWDQKLKSDATLKNKYLYYLVSDASLMSFEGTWCVYFNKPMLDDINVPYPYDTVRSGKWTLDALFEIAHQGGSLNGDSSFAFSGSGRAVYGMASFKNLINALVTGANEMYCRKDEDDIPYYALGSSETYVDVAEKIVQLTGCTADGTYISTNSSGKHYIADVFTQNRSLLCGAEIKAAASEMNQMESEFGIVPIPKYSEDQESYYSNMLWSTLLLTIPTSCSDVDRAAIIMDALSYYAMTDVLPYYKERVCYKGLKDADSIEMLDIIHDTRYLNWGLTYSWLSSIEPQINTYLDAGNSNIATLVKGTKGVVEKLIRETVDSLEGLE